MNVAYEVEALKKRIADLEALVTLLADKVDELSK